MGSRESCFKAQECYNYSAKPDEKQQNVQVEGKPKKQVSLVMKSKYLRILISKQISFFLENLKKPLN